MKDYIDLGPSPIGEDCLPANHPDSRKECDRYRDLCREIYPQAEEYGCYFTTKSNAHDFGTYYEVNIVVKDDNNEDSIAYAYWVQDNQPERWTDTEERIYTEDVATDDTRIFGPSYRVDSETTSYRPDLSESQGVY